MLSGRWQRRTLAGLGQFMEPESLKAVWYGWLAARDRRLYAGVDTVFRLEAELGLPKGQFVTFAQTVGYPA